MRAEDFFRSLDTLSKAKCFWSAMLSKRDLMFGQNTQRFLPLFFDVANVSVAPTGGKSVNNGHKTPRYFPVASPGSHVPLAQPVGKIRPYLR